MVRSKKMRPKLIREKEITPASFQTSPVKSTHPASGRHRGAVAAAFLKKPGQACSPPPCWPTGVWNRALYQLKYLDAANCSLALSSCGSSWFYNTQSESLFWARRVLCFMKNWEVWVLIYNYLHELQPEDSVCCACYSSILKITKQSIIVVYPCKIVLQL